MDQLVAEQQAKKERRRARAIKTLVKCLVHLCEETQNQVKEQCDYSSEEQQFLLSFFSAVRVVLHRWYNQLTFEAEKHTRLEQKTMVKHLVEEVMHCCAYVTDQADREQRDYLPEELAQIAQWVEGAYSALLRPDQIETSPRTLSIFGR